MSEERFIELGNEILHSIQGTKINDSHFPDKVRLVKSYIINHADSNIVNEFIEAFIDYYEEISLNEELVKAFHEPKFFYRQIQIYKNLPFTIKPLYGDYIFDILELDGFPYVYRGLKSAFEKYRKGLLNNPYINGIFEYFESNSHVFKGSKDDYYSLDEEKKLYRKANNGESFIELKYFMWSNDFGSENEAREPFMRKKEGNIGEIYTFDLINSNNKVLVARDIKNGFGYDIYFEYNNQENLVEVKTTFNDISLEDAFELSKNEYRVMLQCLNNPSANYIVSRVRLNFDLSLATATILIMNDSTTFTDYSTGTQYKKEEINGRILFRKCPQYQKKLQ